jgi:hypothetical protein
LIIGFTIFTDRNIDGRFLEIERKNVTVIRQVSMALVGGHEYQFRVQPENDQFHGEVSDPSPSLTVAAHHAAWERIPKGTRSQQPA